MQRTVRYKSEPHLSTDEGCVLGPRARRLVSAAPPGPIDEQKERQNDRKTAEQVKETRRKPQMLK